eukprot:838748-Amphidinium_carterae.1
MVDCLCHASAGRQVRSKRNRSFSRDCCLAKTTCQREGKGHVKPQRFHCSALAHSKSSLAARV